MKMINKTLVILVILFFAIRSSNIIGQTQPDKNGKQFNINILLDLSDRISVKDHPDNPQHYQKDMAIVNHLVHFFKRDMVKRGAYKAKGKIKVFFTPLPNDPNVNQIAQALSVDLSKMDPQQKKRVYDNISTRFKTNLEKIYQKTLATGNFIGSDIWRFFKNDVKNYIVSNNPNYRNILVLITDGYIYHPDSKRKVGNRSEYILGKVFSAWGLGGDDWRNKFDKGDYGFITMRKDLQNLDILVLEITPDKGRTNDEDIIRAYLSKWFKEMNVRKFEIYNTDLPANLQSKIESFFK